MTIDLPVHVDLLETDARLAWRIVDANGVTVPWGTVAAALNTPPRNAAPDLTALREARERSRSAQADMDGEVPGTEEWFAERDAVLAAREDVLDAVDLLLEKDDTP